MSNSNNAYSNNVKPKVTSLNLASSFKPQSTTQNKSASGILLLGRKNAQKSVNIPKPVQLPSYKKESRGFDSTVSIVPTGQSGWRIDTTTTTTNASPTPLQQPTTQPSQPATQSSTQPRFSAPAVPQPVKYNRSSISTTDSSNDVRRNDDTTYERQSTRQYTDADETMSNDTRRRQHSNNQWDDDEEMDFSKPVVFADGSVAGATREQQQSSRWSTQTQSHTRDSDTQRQSRDRLQRSTAQERSQSPEPRRLSQYNDDTEQYMKQKAAERRLQRQMEEEQLLREQHQRAQEKLAEIERKLGRSSVSSTQPQPQQRYRNDSEYSNDSRTRRYSEHSQQQQELRFGASNIANEPVQQFKLMQRPKSQDSVENDNTDNNTAQSVKSPETILKKQKPLQLVTKLQHNDDVEQAPIKIVPQQQMVQPVEQPVKPAWKQLPQVQPLYTYDRDDGDDTEQYQQSSHGEHDRFNNARTSDELIAAAAATFSASEYDRGTISNKHRQNSVNDPNQYISTAQRKPIPHTVPSSDVRNENDAQQQRRPPIQRAAPRKWTSDETEAKTPVTNTVRSITTTTTADPNKVLNIMDLPLTAAGVPILPGLTQQQTLDKLKQQAQKSNKTGKKDTVKQVTDIIAAVPSDKREKRERKEKSKPTDTDSDKTKRKSKKEYSAKRQNSTDAATEQLLAELQLDDDTDNNTESGFEKVLSKKEKEELTKQRKTQEAKIEREKAKLQRQNEYKQNVEREKRRSQNSTPSIETDKSNTTKPALNVDVKPTVSNTTQLDVILNQMPTSYPQQSYNTSNTEGQSQFMSMFRQSPAPSLSPAASYADSQTAGKHALSPSGTNASDDYLLQQSTRDTAIRNLMTQSNVANNSTTVQNQLFSGWNEQQSTSNTNVPQTSPFGSTNSLGLTFGGLSSVNLSHIHVLAQHFGMAASNVAKQSPQQLAALTAQYNQSIQSGSNTNVRSTTGLSDTTFNTFNTSPFNNNATTYPPQQRSAVPLPSPTNSGNTTDSQKSVTAIKAPLPHRKANIPAVQSFTESIDTSTNNTTTAPPASSRLHGWIPKSAINEDTTPVNTSTNIGTAVAVTPVVPLNESNDTVAAPGIKPKRQNNRNGKKKEKPAAESKTDDTVPTDDKSTVRPTTAARGGRGGKRPTTARVQPVDSNAVVNPTSDETKEADVNATTAAKRNNNRRNRPGGPKQPRDDTVSGSIQSPSQPIKQYKPKPKPAETTASAATPPTQTV